MSLASGQSGNVGSAALPAKFGDGVFFVTAKDEGNGKTTLTSIGLVGCGRSAVSIVVEKKKNGIASLGVFSDGTITVERGALIDSYDSREGTYESQHPLLLPLGDPPTGSRLGSNSDVIVRGIGHSLLGGALLTTIYGDARPGPQGSVVRETGVVITGSTAPSDAVVALPDITMPVYESLGDLIVSRTPSPLRITSGNYDYGALKLLSGTKTEIVGPANIVVSSLEVLNGSQLTIDAHDGPVKIYVKDYVNLQTGSTLVSGSQIPAQVALLIAARETADRDGDGVQDPPVTIQSNGSFYGTVFAPKAALSVPSSLALYGAIAAKQLSIRAGAKVHFDQALLETSAEDAALPHVLGWRLVPLPRSPLVSLRFDVLKLLQLENIVPVPAAAAHYAVGIVPDALPADAWSALNLLHLHGGTPHGPH
jgi:hypothetical protein